VHALEFTKWATWTKFQHPLPTTGEAASSNHSRQCGPLRQWTTGDAQPPGELCSQANLSKMGDDSPHLGDSTLLPAIA
jgi:hypothetical protein